MSIKLFKHRLKAVLLFFIDYKAILYCFTILSFLIPISNLLEQLIYEGKKISLEQFFQFFIPSLILLIFFGVSYWVLLHVQFIGTLLKIFLISLFIASSAGYLKYRNISSQRIKVRSFTNKNVWITGVVMSQEGNTRYLLKPRGNGIGDSLIIFRIKPDLHVGQKCKLKVKVVEPKSFEDFDYKRYLFRKGIYTILIVEEYECEDWGNIALEIRYKLERIVERNLLEPEASLLIGIMFGSKRIFIEEFKNALNSAGVSHIIAASGYNVALVVSSIGILTRRFAGKWVAIVQLLCIWIFCIFSGLSSSVVRAGTMTSLYLFALLWGREVNKGIALIFCATVMILLNPFLIHDLGFLFSFSSTMGLIFFSKCFLGVKSKFLKDSFLPTLTCLIFTLPISIFFFGKVSIVSIISNIIIIPIVNSTMFWGLGATIINIFVKIKILYLVPYIQLSIFKYLVTIASNIEMLELNVRKELLVLSIYTVLVLFCFLRYPVSQDNWYLKKVAK